MRDDREQETLYQILTYSKNKSKKSLNFNIIRARELVLDYWVKFLQNVLRASERSERCEQKGGGRRHIGPELEAARCYGTMARRESWLPAAGGKQPRRPGRKELARRAPS